VAACDVYRPAAVEQLVTVGTQAGAVVYEQGTDKDPVDIARWALDRAKMDGKDVLIVDTSGRLHIDEKLMAELVEIRKAVRPTQYDEDEAKELERKLRRNEFTLEDFLAQLKQVRKMGPLTSLLGMMPGFAGEQLKGLKVDERELDRVQAIILSMTPEERRRPE